MPTHTAPPCAGNVTCWASGSSPTLVSALLGRLLLSIASEPARETKLYYAVTSRSAGMGRLLLNISVDPMPWISNYSPEV